MSNKTVAMGILVATGIAGTICARAADMPALFPTPTYEEAEPPTQFAWGTGWYLRGDLTATNDTVPTMLGTLDGASVRHDWNFGGGGGAGYKFNDYFRADVTGDYLTTEHRSGSAPVTDPQNLTAYTISSRAKLDRWAGLVNGYIDLGNWSGLTPYVGAGIGVAGLSTSGSAVVSGFGATTSTKIGSQDDYQLAWAAMAGVSYQVSQHLLLDVGYRYLDLGTYRAPQDRTVLVGPQAQPVAVYNANKTDLTSHEVRVGLRYQID